MTDSMRSVAEVLKRPTPKKVELPWVMQVGYTSVCSDPESRQNVERGQACPVCAGAGMVRKPSDIEDPEFGGIGCPKCQGTGSAQPKSSVERRQTFSSWSWVDRDNLREGSPDFAAARLMAWCETHDPSWVVLYGPNRVGKTHLGYAVVDWHLRNRTVAMIEQVPELLEHLRPDYVSESGDSSSQRFEGVKCVPVLVLDDIGRERGTEWENERLYQLLSRRYELPTVFTTNLRPSDFEPRFRSRVEDPSRCAILAMRPAGRRV